MVKKKKSTGEKKETKEEKVKKVIPLQINIIGWFGIALSLTYLIWGVVNIVLSIMDRTYSDMGQNFIILIYGLPILILGIGFINLKKWSWYGLGAVLAFIVVWTLFTPNSVYGIIWGILALGALLALLTPPVRKHFLKS